MSFPDTTEEPHFHKTSFRIKKKIFATYDPKSNTATVKLTRADQDTFAESAPDIIYPVEEKWGEQGWTRIDLELAHPDVCKDVLSISYNSVAK